MSGQLFRLFLYLPAQGAAETEATIVEWYVSEGQQFEKGQVLGQVDSAKSVFDFEAPCAGRLLRIVVPAGETVSYEDPVLEIETADPSMKDWIPPAADAAQLGAAAATTAASSADQTLETESEAAIVGLGGYLPARVVTNEELAKQFAGVSAEYVHQVTGIRQRRWASEDEKPSDMAVSAAQGAIEAAGLGAGQIDALILATSTPDVAMPATACIVVQRLGLSNVPAFDLNAACSGWIYALSVARAMVLSGTARCVLTIGVDVQSRLLDQADPTTRFLFGDGAGAAVVARSRRGHQVKHVVLGTDVRGLHMARRSAPGYYVTNGRLEGDPWIRLEGQPLFRLAAEGFAAVIQQAVAACGWTSDQVRWVVPHQANARILRAAAKRSGIPFERFFLNMEHIGNTSSASIPLALLELQNSLRPGDKLVLCSVGAGLTSGAVAVQW